MTARHRSILAATTLAALALTASGCAAQEPSYSSLDDAAMIKLFPTETEIKTALGDVKTVMGPRAEVPKPSFTPAANNGSSPECYEAAYGTAESRANVPTRMFVMASTGSDASFSWVVAQQPTAEDVRKKRADFEDRVRKCSSFESFDAGTASGNNFASKPSGEGKLPAEGASAFVTSGNVSLAFNVQGVPYEKAKELVKKMAPVMEKRLKASAPRS